MTTVADTTSSPEPDIAAGAAPRLADGIELLGEYEAGGFVDPTYLACRPDGQVVQLSRLLYVVARHLDGASDLAEVAERVGADYGRPVSAANVAFLVERRLAPLGLIAPEPGEEAPAPVATALLAMGLRAALLPASVVQALSRPFSWLFRAPVVAIVLASLVAIDGWLFLVRGVGSDLIEVATDPALLAVIGAVQIFTSAFHELGHASACRYGGARPGRVGVGIFLIWPVFYSDVTDSYRLNRRGRLRTDLGGVYFDAVATLLLAVAYAATGWDLLLVAIAFEQIDIAYQFVPFLRLDGYYMVSDLVGVPDLHGRIGPILRSLVPGREPEPPVAELKPRVRSIVTAWVVLSVAVILAGLGLVVVNTPAWFDEAGAALTRFVAQAQASWADGDLLGAAFSAWRAGMLFVPLLGTAVMVQRILSLRRRSRARRRQASGDDTGELPVDLDAAASRAFRVRWRGYDRDEVRAVLAGMAARQATPEPEPRPVGTDADAVVAKAHHQARLIVEAAHREAAAILERARREAEHKTMLVIRDARQIYEGAKREAEELGADAERRAAEVLDAARRQLDLAVELKVELRRGLEEGEEPASAPLRIVADPPSPPSLAS